jgi:hypothetical protein
MQNLINYIKNSDLSIELFLNPFKWGIYHYVETKSDMDPGLLIVFRLTVGPIGIHFYINDGKW